MAVIGIAADVYDALKLPEEEREITMKAMLAVALYEEGALPFGKARDLAGVSKRVFHRLLGEWNLPRHYPSSSSMSPL